MKEETLKKKSRFWMEKYQNNKAVQFKQIEFLQNREFACLIPSDFSNTYMYGRNVRFLRCHSVQHIEFILNDLLTAGSQGTIYNLYYSLGSYKNGMYPISWTDMKKRKLLTDRWTKTHYLEMVSYDWLIDFDVKKPTDNNKAYADADKLHKFLNDIKIPHEIRFSGRGFHIIIPYYILEPLKASFEPLGDRNIYDFLSDMTKILYKKFSKLIDYDIFDSRRLCKLPFSAVHYETHEAVCVPISSEKDWQNFDYKKCTMDNMDYILSCKRFIFNDKSDKDIYTLLEALNLGVEENGNS